MKYDFPVLEAEVKYALNDDYHEIPRKKAIINAESGDVISIVSDRYEITKHSDVMDRITPHLPLSSYRLTGDGGVLIAKFNIPTVKPIEVKKGDTVQFYLRAYNSYNTITGCGIELYGDQLICTNGLTVPKHYAGFYYRHLNNEGSSRIADHIKSTVTNIDKVVNVWKNWIEIEPKVTKINSFINKLELDEETHNTLTDEMTAKKTLWDMYAVLTKYTTHTMVNRGKNKIANQRKKEMDYANKFYTHDWRE